MKGSTDWLDPEEPRCWYCQCFSSDGFRGLEDLEASLVALRPDLAELLGFVKDLARGAIKGLGPARESETEFVLCRMV